MKNSGKNTWTHKGWTIYKAGPFPGFPKKYVFWSPNLTFERYEQASLASVERFIDARLAFHAFIRRVKEEAEWIQIEE